MTYVLRSLFKTPGFTAIAILTLALGIGVNTAMFSVINTLLLSPAPYSHADRLVRIFRTSPQSQTWPHSMPDLDDLRRDAHSFESITAFQWWQFSLSAPGQPAKLLNGVLVTADFFTVLGVQPALGRAFTAEEQQPGRDEVIVLTDALWRSEYSADPAIVGRTIRVDGVNRTVIGVMPANFAYPLFWGKLGAIRPLVIAAQWQHERGNHWVNALGCLRPGVTLAQAGVEADTIAARLTKQYPDTNAGTGLRLLRIQDSALSSTGRNVSWLVLALSGFVLLIACANLANLQLARCSARMRDFAVRAALGASRGRLMRQLLVENVVLGLAGGSAGILIAVWLNDLLSRKADVDGLGFSLAWPVLVFAFLVSVLAGLLAGLIPAWLAARTDLNAALKSQARGSTGDRSRHRIRQSLIVAEIAFALILLAGAGFFIRGLQRFTHRDPGWQTSGLITGVLTLPSTLPTDHYTNDDVRRAFYDHLLERLQALPGVEHASLSSALPIFDYNSSRNFAIEGRPDAAPGHEPLTEYITASPDYFVTIGLPLIEGRAFTTEDRATTRPVVLINESLARTYWPHESAIGKRIGGTDPKDRGWMEVVGVVRDAGFVASFSTPDTRLQMYRPLTQEPWGYLSIALRSANPEALSEPMRRAVAALDPDLPIAHLRTIREAVDQGQHNFQTANLLLSGFAILGLLLAALGLYGVVSTLVVQRTSEFGIRFALGAQAGDVFRLVIGSSAWLAALGCAIGVAGSAGLLVLLSRLIPGLPGADPWLVVATVSLLLLVAFLACWLPARRASKIDPLVALRTE
ncbi:MAG TPA: ABC transporter permease [Candidatus Didemnitutus sp.]|nr:ABC transporter permease [Candidatus Didemnitutus sp.]